MCQVLEQQWMKNSCLCLWFHSQEQEKAKGKARQIWSRRDMCYLQLDKEVSMDLQVALGPLSWHDRRTGFKDGNRKMSYGLNHLVPPPICLKTAHIWKDYGKEYFPISTVLHVRKCSHFPLDAVLGEWLQRRGLRSIVEQDPGMDVARPRIKAVKQTLNSTINSCCWRRTLEKGILSPWRLYKVPCPKLKSWLTF